MERPFAAFVAAGALVGAAALQPRQEDARRVGHAGWVDTQFEKVCPQGKIVQYFELLFDPEVDAVKAVELIRTWGGAYPKLTQRLRTSKNVVKSAALRARLKVVLDDNKAHDVSEIQELLEAKTHYGDDFNFSSLQTLGVGSVAEVVSVQVKGETKIFKLSFDRDRETFVHHFNDFVECLESVSGWLRTFVSFVTDKLEDFIFFLRSVLAKRQSIMGEFDLAQEHRNTELGLESADRCLAEGLLEDRFEMCLTCTATSVLRTTGGKAHGFTFEKPEALMDNQVALEGAPVYLTNTRTTWRHMLYVTGQPGGTASTASLPLLSYATRQKDWVRVGDTFSLCLAAGGEHVLPMPDALERTRAKGTDWLKRAATLRVPRTWLFHDANGTRVTSVLELEYAPGTPLEALVAAPERAEAKNAAWAYMQGAVPLLGCMLFRGFGHGDPHAANLLWSESDRTLWLLDWGTVLRSEPEVVRNLVSSVARSAYDADEEARAEVFGNRLTPKIKVLLWQHLLDPETFRLPETVDISSFLASDVDDKDAGVVMMAEVMGLLSNTVRRVAALARQDDGQGVEAGGRQIGGLPDGDASLLSIWSAVANRAWLVHGKRMQAMNDTQEHLAPDRPLDVFARYADTGTSVLEKLSKRGLRDRVDLVIEHLPQPPRADSPAGRALVRRMALVLRGAVEMGHTSIVEALARASWVRAVTESPSGQAVFEAAIDRECPAVGEPADALRLAWAHGGAANGPCDRGGGAFEMLIDARLGGVWFASEYRSKKAQVRKDLDRFRTVWHGNFFWREETALFRAVRSQKAEALAIMLRLAEGCEPAASLLLEASKEDREHGLGRGYKSLVGAATARLEEYIGRRYKFKLESLDCAALDLARLDAAIASARASNQASRAAPLVVRK